MTAARSLSSPTTARVSFSEGRDDLVSKANVADIASVPMFVKYPGGARRGVDDRFARTVDLIPTIADVLGIGCLWKVDGITVERLLSFRPCRRSWAGTQ